MEREMGLANLLKHLRTGMLVPVALALIAAPGEAQTVRRAAALPYDSASAEREPPAFAFATDPVATLMSLPPLYLVELPDSVEELRIWVGFGIVIPHVLLRITKTEEGVAGDFVYWWNAMEHPAHGSVFASFYSEMRQLAGRNGCKEAQIGMESTEHRDGMEIKHREWVFACQVDFGSREPDWSALRERLRELRVFDLPDQRTLESRRIVIADGVSIVVEVLRGAHYRTYRYDSPHLRPWPEAKFADSIIDLVQSLGREVRRP
jgi:hypothetical protein